MYLTENKEFETSFPSSVVISEALDMAKTICSDKKCQHAATSLFIQSIKTANLLAEVGYKDNQDILTGAILSNVCHDLSKELSLKIEEEFGIKVLDTLDDLSLLMEMHEDGASNSSEFPNLIDATSVASQVIFGSWQLTLSKELIEENPEVAHERLPASLVFLDMLKHADFILDKICRDLVRGFMVNFDSSRPIAAS